MQGGDAERADGARAAGLVGAAGAAQRAAVCVSSRSAAPARAGRAVPRADGGRGDADAGRDRRLHRFLRVDPSRHQRRIDDAAGQSAPAELQVRPDRLSRTRVVDRRERHADPPAARAGEARRGAAGLSRVGAARLRGGTGHVRRAGQRARRRHPDRSRRRSPLRRVSVERLVRARRAAVGVSAARAVPRQELRDQHLAVGGDDGGAGAVQGTGAVTAGGRSGAAAVSGERASPADGRDRSHHRDVVLDGADARARRGRR